MTPARWPAETLRQQLVCCMYEDEANVSVEGGLNLDAPHSFRAAVVYDQDPEVLPAGTVDLALERWAVFPRWCVFFFSGVVQHGHPSRVHPHRWDVYETLVDARWAAAEFTGMYPHISPLRNMPPEVAKLLNAEIRLRDYLEPYTMTSAFANERLIGE